MQDIEGTPQKNSETLHRNSAGTNCQRKEEENGGRGCQKAYRLLCQMKLLGPYTLQVKILHSCRAAFYIYLILLVGGEKIQHGINLIYFIYSVLNSANGRINYLQVEKGLEVKGSIVKGLNEDLMRWILFVSFCSLNHYFLPVR